MRTSLHIGGANCPTCFNETLDSLARLDGVRAVRGSMSGSCIEIDHVDGLFDVLADTVRDRLHGVEMFSNEIRMVPVDPVAMATPGRQRSAAEPAGATSSRLDANDIGPSMTLGEIVTRHPSLAADLERRGLDYCCHGADTLASAAESIGLDPRTVAADLSAARVDAPPAAWASLGPGGLIDHIETVHHRYLWSELPRIDALVDKILAVHGDRHPELAEVRRLYSELRADFEPHLVREEQVLFPMIRRLTDRVADPPPPDTEELVTQIGALAAEHEDVGELLEQLHRVTGGYATPADGCASYAACYQALARLEADTHLHVHKENNVLFRELGAGPSWWLPGRTSS